MGAMIVCEKVCLSAALLFCDESQSSLVDEISREGIYDN